MKWIGNTVIYWGCVQNAEKKLLKFQRMIDTMITSTEKTHMSMGLVYQCKNI